MSYLDDEGGRASGIAADGYDDRDPRAHPRGRAVPAGPAERRKVLNYPGPGFLHMTKEEWRRLPRNCKGSWLEGLGAPTFGHAAHRVRVAVVHATSLTPVYIIDAVRIDPPRPSLRVPGHSPVSPLSLAARH